MDIRQKGKLYLCPTPIGNLKDMTERAIEILKSADLIAAEDTRNTLRLLNHFDIHTKLTSYHEHNKYDKAEELIGYMLEGKNVACVTDAGTPGISDPGEVLVNKAIDSGLEVVSLPGPTALITALTVSGLPARRFVFEGFLPKNKKEKRMVLEDIKDQTRTVILYESPHHLRDTLKELMNILGNSRRIALCRELTKIHEEVIRLSLEEAVRYYQDMEPKGEYVIVIEGRPIEEIDMERRRKCEGMSIPEHVAFYEAGGFDRKTAMKKAAEDRGMLKRDIYKAILQAEEQMI